jgi:hypothetical protein
MNRSVAANAQERVVHRRLSPRKRKRPADKGEIPSASLKIADTSATLCTHSAAAATDAARLLSQLSNPGLGGGVSRGHVRHWTIIGSPSASQAGLGQPGIATSSHTLVILARKPHCAHCTRSNREPAGVVLARSGRNDECGYGPMLSALPSARSSRSLCLAEIPRFPGSRRYFRRLRTYLQAHAKPDRCGNSCTGMACCENMWRADNASRRH